MLCRLIHRQFGIAFWCAGCCVSSDRVCWGFGSLEGEGVAFCALYGWLPGWMLSEVSACVTAFLPFGDLAEGSGLRTSDLYMCRLELVDAKIPG